MAPGFPQVAPVLLALQLVATTMGQVAVFFRRTAISPIRPLPRLFTDLGTLLFDVFSFSMLLTLIFYFSSAPVPTFSIPIWRSTTAAALVTIPVLASSAVQFWKATAPVVERCFVSTFPLVPVLVVVCWTAVPIQLS